MADLKIAKGDKGRPKRRLRKKYRNSGSENEESSSQKDFTSGVAAMEVLESETEDKLPISSLSWGKCTSKSGKANVEEKSRKETDNPSDNEIEDNVTMLKGTNAVRGVEPEWYDCLMTNNSIKQIMKFDAISKLTILTR